MTTALSFLSGSQITNDSGTPQAGAKLYTYREGTTTALTVWTDDAASVAHANPIPCDAGGFVPLIYVDDTFDYKVVIKTSADVTLKTYDNIPAPDPASTTGYFPTLLTWITKTTAQSPVALTTADAGNAYEADTTSGNVEFDLPAAASIGNGKGFTFKKLIAANSMIIDPSGSETTDDSSTSITITTQYETIQIVSNGAEWYITTRYFDTIVAARLPAASDTASGIQENAVQSEMETGTSTTLTVTPGRQHFHPAHPKCFASVSVSGGVPTLQTSYNITGVTDTAQGKLTVTIATDFSSANWACLASNENSASAGVFDCVVYSKSAGSVSMYTDNSSAIVDPVSWSMVGLGDL